MKKKYLISYKLPMFQRLNCEGIEFQLTILVKSFFGLIKKTETIMFEVPPYERTEIYTEHWDKYIKNKTRLIM